MDLFAERRAKFSNLSSEVQSKNDSSSAGWRMLGNIWRWRPDWSTYDAKLNKRKLQEKTADKARQRRKRRKQQLSRIIYQSPTNGKDHRQGHMGKDKELLAIAKVKFSGPPSTTDHPISGLSVPKQINFRKGETINPYRESQSESQQQQQQTAQLPCSSDSRLQMDIEHPPLLDPMRPPIVRLTEQSASGDRRFLKARLRDPKIMDIVRMFLSYLHDQPATVCIRGTTKTSATAILASEGLPTDLQLLRQIFLEAHEDLGISRNDALADLQSHRTFLSSERTQHLQRSREAAYKFYNPSNFHRQ